MLVEYWFFGGGIDAFGIVIHRPVGIRPELVRTRIGNADVSGAAKELPSGKDLRYFDNGLRAGGSP